MYYNKYLPYHMTFPLSPEALEAEREESKELELMKSYYPMTARQVQEKVERECDRLDYPGSMIYDEYPDKFMLRSICSRIAGDMQAQDISRRRLDDLIEVLLYEEISRRRCRRRRCRRYF